MLSYLLSSSLGVREGRLNLVSCHSPSPSYSNDYTVDEMLLVSSLDGFLTAVNAKNSGTG